MNKIISQLKSWGTTVLFQMTSLQDIVNKMHRKTHAQITFRFSPSRRSMKPSSSSDKVAVTGDWGIKKGMKFPGSPPSLSFEESYKAEFMAC